MHGQAINLQDVRQCTASQNLTDILAPTVRLPHLLPIGSRGRARCRTGDEQAVDEVAGREARTDDLECP